MPFKITMPALSPTMEEGDLVSWKVKVGDKVSAGDTIAEIETDKANMDVDVSDDGIVAKLVVPANTKGVKVNSVIAILAEEGEDLEAAIKAAEGSASVAPVKSAPTAPKAEGVAKTEVQIAPAVENKGARVFASPLARRLASQAGIDLSSIKGSGPHGRIIKRDLDNIDQTRVEKATTQAANIATPAVVSGASDEQVLKLFKKDEYELLPHDGMRKTIAKRLVESKQTVPHFYVTVDCELDALLKLRSQLNAASPVIKTDLGDKPAYRLSVNDMLIKAVALTLKALPDANVSWLDSGMLRHKHADVGVAVSIPNGLITPIIRHAEEKSLSTISNEMKDYAKRARDRKLKPEEYQGGSTSVSNMGMFGVKDFAAIVNPPQATIFAIGSGEQRAIVKDGALAIATMMSITLSTDHRAIDGALAAQVVQTLKNMIENPLGMLV